MSFPLKKTIGLEDNLGSQINPSTEEKQDDIISALGGTPTGQTDTPESFEDSNFIAGDSPVTLDCNTALGRNATRGYIINDGDGSFTIEFSNDGSNWGNTITIKKNEKISFNKISVNSLRITHSGTDSAYRVSVI